MGKKASGILWLILFATIIFSAAFLASGPSHAAVGSWSSNGPALTKCSNGIALRGMAFSPQYTAYNKLFASAENGYLHISSIDNGEVTWRTVDCNQLIGSNFWQLTALEVAPDNTVFVATSNGYYYNYLRSPDGGINWQVISGLPGHAHWSFAVSPNYMQDKTVFLCGNTYGVLKSTDGGLTWTEKTITSGLGSKIAISPNFKTDKTVYVGGGAGMFRSTDYGENWFRIDTGLGAGGSNPPYPDIDSIAISPNFADDNTLFVQNYTKGVFKSQDRGNSWECVNNTVYSGELAISPNYINDGMLALRRPTGTNTGDAVFISRDSGYSWNEQLPDLPISPHYLTRIAFSPNFANDQTIYVGTMGSSAPLNGIYAYTFGAPPNSPPTANAGTYATAHLGTLIILNGGASTDLDGDVPLSYEWSLPYKPAASTISSLTNANTVNPSFTPDAPGDYVIQLIVTDSRDARSQPAQVTISTSNTAPVANPGSDQPILGLNQKVTLDGSGSTDADGDPITYLWTLVGKPVGSTATLDNLAAVNPSFVVDVPGNYKAQLVVSDLWVDSIPKFVTISAENLKPVANAGVSQPVHVGTPVTLNGSASTDPDQNYPLNYAWSFTTFPGENIPQLSGADTLSPTFTPNKEGSYTLQLIVTDSLNLSSDACTVTISTINSSPIAKVGDHQFITEIEKPVTLDGTASYDPDQIDTLTYQWSLTNFPTGSTATLNGDKLPTATFVPNVQGTYVAQLTVTDPWGASSTATVMVSFTNIPPVTIAGADQQVQVIGATVNLDGSGSYDENSDPLTYYWSLSVKPTGSTAQINPDPNDPSRASFVVDLHGVYVAELVTKDPYDASSTAQATISFNNLLPVADAGASQSVKVGDPVTLDGSKSSDPNRDTLTYAWSIISSPAGSSAALSSVNSVLSSFQPDMAGSYMITLTVNDGFGGTDFTNIQIQAFLNTQTVTEAIQSLEAIIGNQGVLPDAVFKNPTMRKTMTNKLNSIIANIDAKNYQEALAQLENDLLQKTDGFYGGNLKNDWIKTQEAQAELYPALTEIIKNLKNMM